MVIYNAGMTHFDLIIDTASSRCLCPQCRKPIIPVTCAFNNCEWKYSGIKLEGEGSQQRPKVVESADWQTAGDAYERFPEGPSNEVHWVRLLIIARKSTGRMSTIEGAVTAGSGGNMECSVCAEAVNRFSSDAVSTPCGHQLLPQGVLEALAAAGEQDLSQLPQGCGELECKHSVRALQVLLGRSSI